MYEAASLKSIKDRVASDLPRTVVLLHKEPVHEIGFMVPQMMNRPQRYRTVQVTEERNSKLIGILLCHPQSPLAKTEILGHLPFFHVSSGEAIDFFCAGYGAYWPPEHHADQEAVAHINGEKWLFSNDAYLQVIEELERESKWKYSGETELLLLPAVLTPNGTTLRFESAIVCNLEAMSKDEAFTSVRSFFNSIFRYVKDKSAVDPAWDFSDRMGLEVAGVLLKSAVLSLLPSKVEAAYKQASHYAVRNIANDC